jgi:hypothetical protein
VSVLYICVVSWLRVGGVVGDKSWIHFALNRCLAEATPPPSAKLSHPNTPAPPHTRTPAHPHTRTLAHPHTRTPAHPPPPRPMRPR